MARPSCCITMSEIRWVTGGSSYLSSHDKRVLIGLGARSSGATVSAEIRWPNGFIQRLSGIEMNRYHTIAEPSSGISQRRKVLRLRSELNGKH
ncbi:MAG: hypothetical protein DMG92_18545 [Acidobacteria bacterium]|nr:MAG: hypothetical protein DMG92_18545 [Acidobacteriota bacterium]